MTTTVACFDLLKSHLNGSRFLAAFAYGSGVFRQSETINELKDKKNCPQKKKMVDFLVVVSDNELDDFNERNMKGNPADYPLTARLALKSTSLFTDSVYYVPSVPVAGSSGQMIKYGVTGWNTLINDLYTWRFMFLAGRLHKPTLLDCGKANSVLEVPLKKAMEFNYEAAMNTAILLSPSPSDFNQILKTIVGLSYTNDPRLLLAESPRKIENIVNGQRRELEAIYLDKWEGHEGRKMIWDPLVRMRLLNSLPCALKMELTRNHCDLWSIALSSDSAFIISSAIGRMVRRSAWRQMFLGSISTSPTKSIEYISSKVSKRFE